MSQAVVANRIVGRGPTKPGFRCRGAEFGPLRRFLPKLCGPRTQFHSNNEIRNGYKMEGSEIARGLPLTVMSTCLLSSSGLGATSRRILNMQRQHHQQATALNHFLDPALCTEAVNGPPSPASPSS